MTVTHFLQTKFSFTNLTYSLIPLLPHSIRPYCCIPKYLSVCMCTFCGNRTRESNFVAVFVTHVLLYLFVCLFIFKIISSPTMMLYLHYTHEIQPTTLTFNHIYIPVYVYLYIYIPIYPKPMELSKTGRSLLSATGIFCIFIINSLYS